MTTPDQPTTLRPSITIRATYRQLGAGPEEIEVSWDDGTTIPSAQDICAVLDKLTTVAAEGER